MKKKWFGNNKGEVFTLTVVLLVAVSAFILGTTKYSKLFGLGSDGQKTKQTMITKTESKPIIVTGQDGKQYVLQATKSETSTLDMTEEPKTTIWQKLLMIPRVWLLLMILGIFFPPIATIMHFINSKLKGEFKKVVVSVDEALKHEEDPIKKQKMLDAMSKVQDKSTKNLVAKLKAAAKP